MVLVLKNLSVNAGDARDTGRFLGQEDPRKKKTDRDDSVTRS